MSNLGTLRNINPRVTWKHEDENFTPWLSENLTLLANVLNMSLELVEEQVEVGRYKCDLLCRNTKNGENEYWQKFTDYLKQHGSELEVLRWQGDPDYLVFYLGYGENNAQHPKYWASVGRSNGYIAANFCLNKQHFTENLKWFSKNKKLVNQKFNEVFGAEPQRPDNPYVVVGVSQRSNDKSEWNSEFEWLRENIEKIERLFKPGGEIVFLSGGKS